MILYDFHTHTAFSSDSKTPAREQADEAVRRGLKGICFTDHMDVSFPYDVKSPGNFIFDADRYFEEMIPLREEYKDRLDIRIGMEIGLRNEPGLAESTEAEYKRLLEGYSFDFIIGSTHCLENVDPYFPYYWENKTVKEGIRIYYEAILHNVKAAGSFDSCGHLDYLIRYVPHKDGWKGPESYRPAEYMDIIDEILKVLINRGIALECNSAGLKYGIGFAHPHDDILDRYRELGGELITIGSDGHCPEHLCYDFDKVEKMLSDHGFRYYMIYRDRKPEALRL